MSVAATYAEALYEAAVDANALDQVASGVGEFAAAFEESAELRAALGNPEIDRAGKRAIVTSLSEGAHPHVTNVLQVLVDRGRILELPEIAAAFQARVARAEQRLDVEAVTAIPLPADLRERIVASITEKTGQSVTLMPGDWHSFWAEGGDALIGEVSTVNDDLTDNVFKDPIGRFADIDEDVAPTHLLVSDYPSWLA